MLLKLVVVAAATGVATGLSASRGSPAAFERVTIIAPAAPGGGWDMTARAMQEALEEAGIVRSVRVENIAGAGGTIGLAAFARRAGDPNQWLMTGKVMVGVTVLHGSPVTLADVTPIARLTSEWQAVAVTPESRIRSIQDLVSALRANVGAVSWGGGSAGDTDHITAALIAKAAGVDPAKINYIAHAGGGESLASILGGHVTVGINSVSEFMPLVRAGRLRIIGITSEKRLPGVDAPTFREAGLDVVVDNWRGVVAAPRIRDADRAAIAAAVTRMVESDAWKAKLRERGWKDNYLSGAAFETFLKAEQERVREILRQLDFHRWCPPL